MWKDQLKELNRRIKRATKRWDAAEERLRKKLEDEEERKRQQLWNLRRNSTQQNKVKWKNR